MLGQSEILKLFQNRFPFLFYALVAGFGILELRMLQLQIFRGSMYRTFSESNSVRKERLPGPRGQMFDRFGRLLVDNRLQLDVVVTPQFIRNPKQTMTRLAELNGDQAQRLIDLYLQKSKGSPRFQPITILSNAPWDLVVKIESSKDELHGVDVETRIRRTYLLGNIGAQVFGYVNEVNKTDIDQMSKKNQYYESGDFIGRYGLEKQWERYLRGKDGERYVVVDAHGHRAAQGQTVDPAVSNMVREDLAPEAGSSLVLTIDSDLQLAAAESMTGMMGAVVALDPRSGEVLAMISQPSFDPTDLSSQDAAVHQGLNRNPFGPLRNKAIQDHFSPGSTFKVFTALAALENGIITPSTLLNCPPILNFAGRPYHEHNKNGFGTIDIREAIKRSSNVFLWQLAMRLNINQIADVAKGFGMGARLGIDLPNEVPGRMETKEF
jgi:penicillin-binding protein 2